MATENLYEKLIVEFTEGCKERVEFAKQIAGNNNQSASVFELSKISGSYIIGFISACKILAYQKILAVEEFSNLCNEVSRIWNCELERAEEKDGEVKYDEQ